MKEKKKLYSINTLFLGESGVGKSSIIKRLIGKGFDEIMLSTISPEIHFVEKITLLNEEDDNSEIKINIWDTAGQEQYRAVCKGLVQKADIIIFVRDNQKENFIDWFNFVEGLIDIQTKKIIYCLNKTDIMSEEEKLKFFNELNNLNKQKKHHATVQCVSSKNSDGIFNLKSLIEEKSQEIISNSLKRYNHNINIILIGNSGVGKSCLVERIINNSFQPNVDLTVGVDNRYFKLDLKNHSSIIYRYIDIPGQERFISTWIHLLDNTDIIIFVNEKDNLKVNTHIIQERVLLSDKKIICCISKKDLNSDVENIQILKDFKRINEVLNDKPLILVSSKTSEGIIELKNKIKEYSFDIIEGKNKKEKISDSTNLELEAQYKKKNCC